MRVGILDILSLPSGHVSELASHFLLTKQYAGITPQTVSVWCKQLGHETHYATYYGVGKPEKQLPGDLDVVFISCYTQACPLAYALAKIYKKQGAITVIGGPHAKGFPKDALRFFDIVVKECNKELVKEILDGVYDPGSIISSCKPFDDVPTVEERMPEIRRSAFIHSRKRYFMTTVPMLASMGCPYTCDFCIDWNNDYRMLPEDRLAEDLRYLSTKLTGTLIAFHDPNFAIKFDAMLSALEAVPRGKRPPYIMESSLSVLKADRLPRLRDTNCVTIAPGVESWGSYSKKAGAGKSSGNEKVAAVVQQFKQLHEHVPYLQGNFLFGLDHDEGPDPVRQTIEFMDQTPYVWPTINIPVPFGGTPLYDEHLQNDRVLKSMPFCFYYAPYKVITIKNYEPVEYYDYLISMFEFCASKEMLKRRIKSSANWKVKAMHWARTKYTHVLIKSFRRIRDMLATDTEFRQFHEGKSTELPKFYQQEFGNILGRYAELLTPADRIPVLEQKPPALLLTV